MLRIIRSLLLFGVFFISQQVHSIVRYPIAFTALYGVYGMKDRCVSSYHEIAPLLQVLHDEVEKNNTDLSSQAYALVSTLRLQLKDEESLKKYHEAYKTIGCATAITLTAACFVMCKH